VRHLVTLHGGSVDVRSTEGAGSEFVVRLPRASEAPVATPAPAASTGEAPAPSPAPAKRILVVDDNPDAAELLALLLKLEGHEVMAARDGPAAVRMASEFRPDVVFLDLGLPGMDGYEVARRLRQDNQLADVVLVAVTGYGADDDRQRSHDAGIDHHLVKPVDIADMKQLLRGVAARPER
jgi:CheY-like chemotaxis protein